MLFSSQFGVLCGTTNVSRAIRAVKIILFRKKRRKILKSLHWKKPF